MSSFKTVFGIDLRTLALFRIGLALMILVDLISRARDISAFYTDDGLLSRTASMALSSEYRLSLYWMNGSEWFVTLLFVIAAFVAILLLIGYKSRTMAFISWIFLFSIVNRNSMIVTGGDVLLVVMCFWAILLPIGARFSIDSSLNRRYKTDENAVPDDHRYFSVVSVAVLLQVMYLYFFTALLKTSDDWQVTMDAAYYAVHIEQLATVFAVWMRGFPELLTFGTYFVWYLEIIAIFLVFSPIFHVQLRLFTLALLIVMHSAFFLSLHIVLFPFIDFMSLSLLIPGVCWDWLAKFNAKPKRRDIVIFYDEGCGFCKKTCLILRNFLLPDSVKIHPAQKNPDIYPIMEKENSWVLRDHQGGLHTHWNGVQYLFRVSLLFRPIGVVMGWKPLLGVGNRLYRWIADNRDMMGRITERFLPYNDQKDRAGYVENCVALGALYIVTYYNVSGVQQFHVKRPQHVSIPAKVLRIDQHWGMFAPSPLKFSLMPVIEGKTRGEDVVDVWSMSFEPPSRVIPELLSAEFKNYRWRKYFGRLHSNRNKKVLAGYGGYLCKQWNNEILPKNKQLASFTIEFERLRTMPNYRPRKPSTIRVWTHWCFKEYAKK
ncbi:DCC1-like thiol-disulfide oxidoreductase family protein [Enterovibrio sp. FF113]|uniref:DCC1-like thiol-disulfide oxidoreductase family protein n=1 Tax=Enterovibrio sp. FF113 TaxID=3230010 RepID=UPI00352E39F7